MESKKKNETVGAKQAAGRSITAIDASKCIKKCIGRKASMDKPAVESPLAAKLAQFDIERHGGEAMAWQPIGKEIFDCRDPLARATPLDVKLEKLKMRALDRVFAGTEWLLPEQLFALDARTNTGPAQVTAQWKIDGKLFSIKRGNQEVIPRYALGDDMRPLPCLEDIIREFNGWSSLAIAAWFESTSSFLQGRRPRELVVTAPVQVIKAAQDAVMHLS